MSDESVCLEGRRLTHAFGQGESRTTVLRDVSLRLRRANWSWSWGRRGAASRRCWPCCRA